ncbi:MAG: hypothetical protein EOP94_04080 [Zymomonas sp.]|nr:MAG: hypothetical protein EOP94_04080 [Zymomonas sp.]
MATVRRRRAKPFRDSLDFVLGWWLGQILPRGKHVIWNTGSCARDRIVERARIRPSVSSLIHR